MRAREHERRAVGIEIDLRTIAHGPFALGGCGRVTVVEVDGAVAVGVRIPAVAREVALVGREDRVDGALRRQATAVYVPYSENRRRRRVTRHLNESARVAALVEPAV